jgi:hypothetical protein
MYNPTEYLEVEVTVKFPVREVVVFVECKKNLSQVYTLCDK